MPKLSLGGARTLIRALNTAERREKLLTRLITDLCETPIDSPNITDEVDIVFWAGDSLKSHTLSREDFTAFMDQSRVTQETHIGVLVDTFAQFGIEDHD